MDKGPSPLALGFKVKFTYPEGATPLEPSEAEGLRLPHITTREELNRWEYENILEAELRYFSRRPKGILTVGFVTLLHRRMFGKVWKWAGKFRTSDKNLGVPFWEIAAKTHDLCEDARLWVESAVNPPDEVAARFHHRLVSILETQQGRGWS